MDNASLPLIEPPSPKETVWSHYTFLLLAVAIGQSATLTSGVVAWSCRDGYGYGYGCGYQNNKDMIHQWQHGSGSVHQLEG